MKIHILDLWFATGSRKSQIQVSTCVGIVFVSKTTGSASFLFRPVYSYEDYTIHSLNNVDNPLQRDCSCTPSCMVPQMMCVVDRSTLTVLVQLEECNKRKAQANIMLYLKWGHEGTSSPVAFVVDGTSSPVAFFWYYFAFPHLSGRKSQITNLCLWFTNTNEIWECSSTIERICPSGGGIGQIRSKFGVGVRSFSRNRSVRNGGVLGESSTYFCGTLRRLSTGQKWDWHMPDACWHTTRRNMAQDFGFCSLL